MQTPRTCSPPASLPGRPGFVPNWDQAFTHQHRSIAANPQGCIKSQKKPKDFQGERDTVTPFAFCFFSLGDINYQEFAKRLWGDIYFNPKT